MYNSQNVTSFSLVPLHCLLDMLDDLRTLPPDPLLLGLLWARYKNAIRPEFANAVAHYA